MTDVKLEDAERVASFIAELCNWHSFSAPELSRLDDCAALLRKIPELQQSWRCFHCGEVCRSEVDARNHFGSTESSEPACLIKAAGEFALLNALRNAEDQLARYRAEDSDTLRAMYSMKSDHKVALLREEESGYAKGVADMRKHGCSIPEGP